MPRPKPPAPIPLALVPLSDHDKAELARCLGRDVLTDDCQIEVGQRLHQYLAVERAIRSSYLGADARTTSGNTAEAIKKAMALLETHFVSADSGVDDETRECLKEPALAFIRAARLRLEPLSRMERTYPYKENLRCVAPFLRSIYEKYARDSLRASRPALRKFVFCALAAVGAPPAGIDETHLDRLDEFLDAEPITARSLTGVPKLV